jgi:thymidylate synthase
MKEIRCSSLGETWLAALREVFLDGQPIGGETRELRSLCVGFEEADFRADPLLARFASSRHVDEMRKVFFSTERNSFGHSYADKLRGPQGRHDLSDVAELLARDPWSKRAVVTLAGQGDGEVPCINAVHFMRRDGGLVASYFARGQDIFRKFYADALCIHEMAGRVAARLETPVIGVSGLISSAHIYLDDLNEIQTLLAEVAALQSRKSA